MVTTTHEASHRIFQAKPELLAPVFRLLGMPLSEKASVEVITPDVTEIKVLERRVDGVLRISSPDEGDPGFLLAVEAQTSRKPEKEVSWGYYLAHLAAKYEVPALLLVVCQDRATAAWARGPFHTGALGWNALTVRPLVLGPDNVPMITDPEEAAADLPLAAFAALTHGREACAPAILEALAIALSRTDDDTFADYSEILEIGLGDTPARTTWRKLMARGTLFPGGGTIRETSFLEGEAKGRASSILQLLELRGIPVSEDVSRRVMECTDLDTLSRWLGRALTVTAAEEMFEGDENTDAAAGEAP
ncbi:hypothetical protein ACIO3O_07665 [Streptomyces sp. NPDC087440]|uniref:hypothetical protein n=1 Tax=Streptomyces sp. NPDC087440 TaxID=3365790 RepID=UPI003806F084